MRVNCLQGQAYPIDPYRPISDVMHWVKQLLEGVQW